METQDRRAVRAGVARASSANVDDARAARSRADSAGQRAPDPPADRDDRRHPRRVRRHHLRQGRERAQHVRALRRRRDVPARRARVPPRSRRTATRRRATSSRRSARSRARISRRRSRRFSIRRARRSSRSACRATRQARSSSLAQQRFTLPGSAPPPAPGSVDRAGVRRLRPKPACAREACGIVDADNQRAAARHDRLSALGDAERRRAAVTTVSRSAPRRSPHCATKRGRC